MGLQSFILDSSVLTSRVYKKMPWRSVLRMLSLLVFLIGKGRVMETEREDMLGAIIFLLPADRFRLISYRASGFNRFCSPNITSDGRFSSSSLTTVVQIIRNESLNDSLGFRMYPIKYPFVAICITVHRFRLLLALGRFGLDSSFAQSKSRSVTVRGDAMVLKFFSEARAWCTRIVAAETLGGSIKVLIKSPRDL